MARHRAARGVKTVGLKPFVVDDVTAARPASDGSPGAAPTTVGLDGRAQLDARRERWETERKKFERSRRATEPLAPSAATASSDP